MQHGHVLTMRVKPVYAGHRKTLGDVLVPVEEVPEEFFITNDKLASWEMHPQGCQKELRTTKTVYEIHTPRGRWPSPIRWIPRAGQFDR